MKRAINNHRYTGDFSWRIIPACRKIWPNKHNKIKKMKKIIALGGSNSKESINKQLAVFVANQIEGSETVTTDLFFDSKLN